MDAFGGEIGTNAVKQNITKHNKIAFKSFKITSTCSHLAVRAKLAINEHMAASRYGDGGNARLRKYKLAHNE